MHSLPPTLDASTLPTALAPMQDVTTLPFMRLMLHYGAPDYFFTEYFRAHPQSTPERQILSALDGIGPQHPIFAQIIGEDISSVTRTMRALEPYPIAGIDLNMGCPAPKIYKKNVGGGLLRDPAKVDQLLGAMRETTDGRFTVKMRIGFADTSLFFELLDVIRSHAVELVSIHGRTVKQMYRGEVDYEMIAEAKKRLTCPVFANGNITSAEKALQVQKASGVDGIMIGRSAIRNPWIFTQIRALARGEPLFRPTLGDVRNYIDALWETFKNPDVPDHLQTNFIKKFLNFVGQGVDPEGQFLKKMRRASSRSELFEICDYWLIENGRCDQPFATEPYEGVIARPNREGDEQSKNAAQSCSL
jgi:tRNA-dihydrouridine synthase|tara:strand:- start:13449 stop:14528 length:1080 start_codon:yes stop_codon:yes gene_type:complete